MKGDGSAGPFGPARDPLWPAGDRPACSREGCEERVYLAGECGRHWAESRPPAASAGQTSTCGRCAEPTIIRRSGLLVHVDRSRDGDHLPPVRQPGDPRTDEQLERREREILEILAAAGIEELPPAYRAAGYQELDPLTQRYMDGDR